MYITVFVSPPLQGDAESSWTPCWGPPIHGKSSQIWKDFPYKGSLSIHGKYSEVFPHTHTYIYIHIYIYIYLHMYIWEDFPHMGRLPMYGVLQHMGMHPHVLGHVSICSHWESTSVFRLLWLPCD